MSSDNLIRSGWREKKPSQEETMSWFVLPGCLRPWDFRPDKHWFVFVSGAMF